MRSIRSTCVAAGVLLTQMLGSTAAMASFEQPASAPPPVTGPAAAVEELAAIPVLRERVGGADPFLYVIRPAAFGLTVADLEGSGLPVVPHDAQSNAVAHLARPLSTVRDTIAALAAGQADTPGEAGMMSASAAAALVNVPITIYSDESNLAVGDNIAQTAWNDARGVLSSEAGINFDVVLYQNDAVAFPSNPSLRVSDVTNDCGLQRFARWEEQFWNAAQAVVVFSDGKIQPTGYPSTTYGLAINGPVSWRMSRGEGRDYCTTPTTWRSPSFIPSAHVSTDLAWGPNGVGSERNPPSHWAAHEIGHLFGMEHWMARCWDVNAFQQNKTLEAATSDTPSHCTSNQWTSAYVFTFHTTGRDYMRAEHQRYSDCRASVWCTASAMPTATPSAVRNLQVTPGNNSATLSWTAPLYNGGSPVAGYCIHRGNTPNFQEGEAGESEWCVGNQLSATWTGNGVVNGQTSYFYVRATNGNGLSSESTEGPASNYVSVVPGNAPNAPVLNAITPLNGRLDLFWSTPSGNGYPITSYNVYRALCSNCQSQTPYATTTTPSYQDTGVTNGTSYFYKVTAVNARGEGPQSNERWDYPRTLPGAPTLDSATGGSSAQVALAWSPPASNGGATISGYNVYRGTTAGGAKSLITSGGCASPVGGTSCTDGSLSPGTYYYQVKAVNNVGPGPFSNERGATVTSGGTPSFSEDFESGITGWSITGSGASHDCTVGQSGCSLRMASTGSAGVTASKSVSVTMGSPTTVSYFFRGSSTGGDTDSSFGIALNTGNEIRLQTTEGYNNGVALYSPSGTTGNFYSWPNSNTWYQAVITINPTTDTASVKIKNTSGTDLATSGNISIPATATSITGLSFNAVFWGGSATTFNYDTVRVEGGTSGAFSETFESGITGWTTTGSGASHDCTVGQSGCSLRMASTGSAGVTVSKSVSVAMTTTKTVSYWFRGSSTGGDTDSSFGIALNTGNEIRLQTTEGYNNGVALYSPSGTTGNFYSWPNSNTWYQAVITINPTTDTASVQIKNTSGTQLGASGNISIPASATSITGLSFNAVFWGGSATTFNYDTVAIA